MLYGQIPLVEKPVSRLALGVLDQTSEEAIDSVLDDFFELGGSVVDTAWLYRDGEHERIVGRWFAKRGTREGAVLVSKGAHTPLCTPEHVGLQLHESLERLGTDYVDLYL